MLLDAHSLIYRAYFALIETPLSTSKGQLVNAAFGFCLGCEVYLLVRRVAPARAAAS